MYVLVNEDYLYDIAEALRSKHIGEIGQWYRVSDMARSIRSIEQCLPAEKVKYNGTSYWMSNFITNVSSSTYQNDTNYEVSLVENYISKSSSDKNSQDRAMYVDIPGFIDNTNVYIIDTYSNAGQIKNTSEEQFYNGYLYHYRHLIPSELGAIYIAYDYRNQINKLYRYGQIINTGKVRTLSCTVARNVRDLGGWECDGGTVKYGKIYRGSEPGYNDRQELLYNQNINIRVELDLRRPGEKGSDPATQAAGTSVFEDKVEYVNPAHIASYTLMQDPAYSGNRSALIAAWKERINTIFNSVSDHKPIYMHCVQGADRTGTLAFIIEAILGVNSGDIDKEYELTCFYTNPIYPNEWHRYRNSWNWKQLMNEVKTYSGSTIRDKIVNWLTGTIGISISDINAFRRNMIDGNPNNLT